MLLELAREARVGVEAGSRAERRLLAASQLLSQLLLQDVEGKPGGGVGLRQGTSVGRIPSVQDPEMRHGRKSRHQRFDGHKLGLAVDSEEQLITAVDVMAGNAYDDEDARLNRPGFDGGSIPWEDRALCPRQSNRLNTRQDVDIRPSSRSGQSAWFERRSPGAASVSES
jgi:hypothetical protein